jgi:hypothetical protein
MPRKRFALPALSLFLASVLSACNGGSDTPAANDRPQANDLSRASLQVGDLPGGYQPRTGFPKEFSNARECVGALAQAVESLVPQLEGLGLQRCYIAVYSKVEGDQSNTPSSGTFLFPDDDKATKALPHVRSASIESLRLVPAGTPVERPRDLPVTGLGQQSEPGLAVTAISGAKRVTAVNYFWRSGNAVIYLGGRDSLGDLSEGAYLELAKKVAGRAAS